MISFYGGPAGQSFNIKKVFSTYAELLNDINKGWKSEVAVGEFVMISYGEPGDSSYTTYRDTDLNAGYGNNNSTLWQKIYNESSGTSTGIEYKFISSCTGFTPRITIGEVTTLAPGSDAAASIDTTATGYPDTVEIDLSIPGGWNFDEGAQDIEEVSISDEEAPKVILTNIGSAGTKDYEKEAYYGRFTFYLKKSQKLAGIEVVELAAEDPPYAYLVTSGTCTITNADESTSEVTASVDEPVLHIGLPQAQTITSIDFNSLGASEEPTVTLVIESTDEYPDASVSNPVLVFNLPIAWDILVNEDVTLANPLENASIEMVEDKDNSTKTLTFTLPRAAQFHYADSESDFAIQGDYYIIKSTGTVYGYNETSATWESIVCFVPQIDEEVEVEELTPYVADGSGTQTTPTADIEYTSDDTWKFTFGLPTAPTIAVGYSFIGASDTGIVTRTFTEDGQGIEINFQIPQGSELLTGVGAPTSTAKNGDFYLDANSGNVYKYIDGAWVQQDGNLKGPTGNPLNIVADLGEQTSVDDAITALNASYSDATSDQIYSAIIAGDSGNIAYWFYKTADQVGTENWSYSQLTGAVDSFIARSYVVSDDKAYSATYVNSLIEGLDEESGELKTYSQAKIDALLSALDDTLNTWGTFADLPQ